jgi:hypothetical protein
MIDPVPLKHINYGVLSEKKEWANGHGKTTAVPAPCIDAGTVVVSLILFG